MAANQGSRAGLITSVVILSIVSVVAIIFAFWYGAEKRRLEQDLGDVRGRYKTTIAEAALTGSDARELDAVRNDNNSGFDRNATLWDIAIGQRNQLVKLVTGADASVENSAGNAVRAGQTALAAAAETTKSANTAIPSTNDDLIGAVKVLADKAATQAKTIADRDAKLADAEKRALGVISQAETDLAARDKQIADIRAEADKAIGQTSEYRQMQQNTIAQIEQGQQKQRTELQAQIDKSRQELEAKTVEVKRLEERLTNTQARFERIRLGVTDQMVRHEDGVITGLSGADIVYISLGRGSQVVPGLTFEVYDRARGIPKMGDPLEEEQPAGKASIEVVRVLDTTSECRVVHKEPGKQIMQGDPILNIVFDPNIKYKFVVHGKFDLDRNKIATEQDAQVIRRLITQWGGQTSDKLGVDTDFLVIGAEPVVPNYSEEELADPVNVKRQQDAKVELQQYQDIIKEARELHIPILNQNRFLNFVGQADAVLR